MDDSRIEPRRDLAVSDLARFGQDRLPLHLESGSAPPSGSRAPPGRSAAIASVPRRRAPATPGASPQRGMRAVIDRQRVQPAAGAQPAAARDSSHPADRRGDQERRARGRGHCAAPSAYFSVDGSSGFSSVACLAAAAASAPPKGTRPRFSSGPPLPHIFEYSGDEVAQLGLGRQVLALEIDVELARAGIGQIGDRRLGRRDAGDLHRASPCRHFLRDRRAENSERARVAATLSGRAGCRSRPLRHRRRPRGSWCRYPCAAPRRTLQSLHRRIGVAALFQIEVGKAVARAGRRRRTETRILTAGSAGLTSFQVCAVFGPLPNGLAASAL